VTVDDAGVLLRREVRTRGGSHEESRAIPRARIASGFYRPGARGGAIILVDARGRRVLDARVKDEETGVALLAALGLDAGKVRMPIDVSSALARQVGAGGPWLGAIGAFLTLGLTSVLLGASPLVPIIAGAFALLVRAWPGRVEIAADGVLLSWASWRRFVRFSDVTRLRETKRSAALELATGETVVLPRAVGAVDTAAMVERLREALDVHRAAAQKDSVASLVARGDRAPADWLAHLRTLRAEDYRTSALRDEDLWRVVEDPSAAPDARAGAAMLLRGSLDDAGRARIRVASDASASPKLRVALDATLGEEEDEAIEERLAELTLPE
jgi:hypothetical protein